MNARNLRRAIVHHLGYDPGEKVKQAATRTEATISEWDVPEAQPTEEELQTIVDNNKSAWESEQAESIKSARRILLKKEIYLLQQINEDTTELEKELTELEK